uniref:Uncharacterized protein n=1 Tax=Ciona savignyi TaxID=51511 RepID=H2ZG52_CIOSA
MDNVNSAGNNTQTTTRNIFDLEWTGINLLLVLIYGFITVLLVAIFAKRMIHRVSLKFSHSVEVEGSGANKSLKLEIRTRMEEAINFAYEPTLLNPGDDRLNMDVKPGHFYFVNRMKTVDGFRNIDQVLGDLNKDLYRPKGKNVRQHLFDAKSHSSGCLRAVRTNQLQALADFYLQARFGTEPYHFEDHLKFLDVEAEIVAILRQRTHRKRTKDKRKELHRQNAATVEVQSTSVDDVEVTLKSNLSPLGGSSTQPLLEGVVHNASTESV